MRILFLGGNLSDQAQLALTHEVEEIGERLRTTDYRDAYQIIQHWKVDAMALQGLLLRHRPTIVHFSGHGASSGELLFEASNGTSAPLEVDVLGSVFAILRQYVRCVVLSACHSRVQAKAIAKSVDVVIGMGDAIPDVDAIAFAGSFYEALGYGEDVQTAFDLARNAIAIKRSPSCAENRFVASSRRSGSATRSVPELIVRPGVSAAGLRFVAKR